MEYVFTKYRKVPSEKVKQKEAGLLTMNFNTKKPMVLLYHPFEQLQKMDVKVGIPYSQAQQLEFFLTLIFNKRDFEKALRKWSLKFASYNNLTNFKVH